MYHQTATIIVIKTQGGYIRRGGGAIECQEESTLHIRNHKLLHVGIRDILSCNQTAVTVCILQLL